MHKLYFLSTMDSQKNGNNLMAITYHSKVAKVLLELLDMLLLTHTWVKNKVAEMTLKELGMCYYTF